MSEYILTHQMWLWKSKKNNIAWLHLLCLRCLFNCQFELWLVNLTLFYAAKYHITKEKHFMSLWSATNFTQNWFFTVQLLKVVQVSINFLALGQGAAMTLTDQSVMTGEANLWLNLRSDCDTWLFWQAPGFYYHQAISRAMWWTTWFSPSLSLSPLFSSFPI